MKTKVSMLESPPALAGPSKRQQDLPAFHQSTRSGDHHHRHHANSRNPLEAILQKTRVADKIRSSVRPASETGTSSGNRLELQMESEVRKKAADAARKQQKQRLASDKAKVAAARQRLEDYRAEQNAWSHRASVTAQNSTTKSAGQTTPFSAPVVHPRSAGLISFGERTFRLKPAGHTTLPITPSARPGPPAPTRPRPKPSATKQSLSILGQLSADEKRAKERKARELKARNERMRAASDELTDSQAQREAEANHALSKAQVYKPLRTASTVPELETSDDANLQPDPDNELVLENTPPPQGPFSLNSAAGVRAVQKSIPRPLNLPYDDVPTLTPAQRFMGTTKTKISLKKSSRSQDLLPITANDLKLYQWRQQKILWAEVLQLYRDLTDTVRTEDSLRTRFRQVSKAIDIEEISQELCEQVLQGDKEAEAELNKLAGQHAGIPVPGANPAGLESLPFRKITKQTPAPRGVITPPTPAPAPRATRGGKILDHDTYMTFLNNAIDVYNEEESDTETSASRSCSPPTEADQIHWEYFMERRDLLSDDIDADYEELNDEAPWREYNVSFSNVGHANAEAIKFIFTIPAGTQPIFKPAEKWILTYEPLGEGMAAFSMKTEHGVVQVRVGRRMLTFQDHEMPDTKEGWLPKTLYAVYVSKCRKAADNMFDEPEVLSYQLDDAVYGSLCQANHDAMEEWLRLTLKPSSANLNEFACRREETRQELQRSLEDAGEDKAFAEAMEDDEKIVEVIVKAVKMKGARN
jgi:hypothetical protein